MPYRKFSTEWLEEEICGCGAGHGSGEAHADFCAWPKVERYVALSEAVAKFAQDDGLASARVQGKMMRCEAILDELRQSPK